MSRTTLPVDLHKAICKGEKLSIVDVREDNEVAEGMIPGAKHIRLGDFENRMSELDRNEEHILVCRSGGRSAKACDLLSREGFKVVNLVGGMTPWNAIYGT